MRKVRHGSLLHWRVRRDGQAIASGQLLGWFSEVSAIEAARRAAEPHCIEGDVIEVYLAGSRIGELALAS